MNKMRGQIRRTTVLIVSFVTLGFLAGFTTAAGQSPEPSVRFEIFLAENAAREIAELGLQVPITGRLFVILSRDDTTEPRLTTGVTGNPFWGKNVRDFSVAEPVVLASGDESVQGYPLESLSDIPAGEYHIQAFVNIYTTFHRADGHTVEMHLNSGASQHLFRSPGNAYSKVQRLIVVPDKGVSATLRLTEVIPPNRPLKEGEVLQQGNYDDTGWVRYIKIKSDKVSAFWGRDMYLGANILIPKGYDENPDVYYPVIYMQGHSNYGYAPVPWSPVPWFREDVVVKHPAVGSQLDGFYEQWTAGKLPKVIVVAFRDANPFYDTSYSVNSANVGPYGDAIMEELIPYIEENFRIIRQPWARVLAGRSTGGWEALAMQVWYPDFFGGTWSWAPDPIDFRKYINMNIYGDNNAFYREFKWIKTARPESRDIDGLVRYTIKNAYRYEQALGDKDRSGGQWAIWQAVYSPVGPDGYPMPLWDPKSGVIDHQVAEYWRENYDIVHKLRQNWSTLGPKLVGKIHMAVGIMDNYYLNEPVYLLEEFLKSTTDPYAGATFEYGWRGRHSWIGHSPVEPEREMTYAEFISVVADYVNKARPQR